MAGRESLGKEAPIVEHVSVASYQQARLWLREAEFADAESVSPHVLRRFPSGVDVAALSGSLNAVVARHEALRTTFMARDGEVLQVVRKPASIQLPVEIVGGASANDVRARLAELIDGAVRTPFDLSEGPILRARLFAAGGEHIVLVVVHHIAFDRWSHGLFQAELAELYRACRAGERPNVPLLAIQYRNYADWQRRQWESGAYTEHVEYWRDQMAHRPPPLELPAARRRGASGPSPAGSIAIEVSSELAKGVAAAAKQVRVSMSVVFLAVFQVALARWGGRDHVLVGSPVANRPLPDTEQLIGLFVNMVPLQARMMAGETFRTYVKRVRGDVFDAYDHQDLFFNHIIASVPEAERGDLVRVVFAYDDATTKLWQTAPFGEPMDSGIEGPVHYDLAVVIQRTVDGISGSANYPSARFYASTVQGFLDDFLALLQRLVGDLDQPLPEPSLSRDPVRAAEGALQ